MRRSLILWGCLLLLLGGAMNIGAQEMTPTPTASIEPTPSAQYVVAFRSATYFPMGVFFQFDVILPLDTEITAATMILESDTLGTVARNLPIENDEVLSQEDVIVDLRYFWEFEDIDETPLVFEPVTYRLSLSLSNDETDVAQGTFTFADHRVEWIEGERGGLPLALTVPEDSLDVFRLIERLRPVYVSLSNEARMLDETLDVILYTDPYTLECPIVDGRPVVENLSDGPGTISCELGRAGELYDRSGYLVFEVSPDSLDAAMTTLTSLLFERAYAASWDGANIPEWFQYGLLTLYRNESDKGRLALTSRSAARNEQLLTLADLQELTGDQREARRLIWESQSYGLVVYMAQRYGLETVFELARSVNAEQSFADLFAEQTGDTLEDLLAAWEVWLFTADAPSVYGLNLYSGPTPLPTFTPSVTPVTPSRTPLPTSTATNTPTITPTPLPPTETPTVTPRPARDVFTPTPTSTPVPPPTVALSPAEPQVVQLALLGVAGLALILVVVGILAGRRRS